MTKAINKTMVWHLYKKEKTSGLFYRNQMSMKPWERDVIKALQHIWGLNLSLCVLSESFAMVE